ncbi:MAG TPA: hypothetical protein VK638_18200 [Edaphobacter sp.]|nr:hypothetical protein [Edaphobacter sp.]
MPWSIAVAVFYIWNDWTAGWWAASPSAAWSTPRMIRAAQMLDLPVVSTFVGRDWTRSLEEMSWLAAHSGGTGRD